MEYGEKDRKDSEDSDPILSLAIQGSPERLERLKEMLDRLLEEAGETGVSPGLDTANWGQQGGWARDQSGWSQMGGWYLKITNEVVKVSRPDEALEDVTKNVYVALSKAEEIG